MISTIGRVNVILIKADDQLLSHYLSNDEIVQYDMLNLKIEDYFYMERGGEI